MIVCYPVLVTRAAEVIRTAHRHVHFRGLGRHVHRVVRHSLVAAKVGSVSVALVCVSIPPTSILPPAEAVEVPAPPPWPFPMPWGSVPPDSDQAPPTIFTALPAPELIETPMTLPRGLEPWDVVGNPPAAMPEPTSVLILGLGFCALIRFRRRP